MRNEHIYEKRKKKRERIISEIELIKFDRQLQHFIEHSDFIRVGHSFFEENFTLGLFTKRNLATLYWIYEFMFLRKINSHPKQMS